MFSEDEHGLCCSGLLKHNKVIKYKGKLTTDGIKKKCKAAKGKEMFLPSLLQRSEVLLEGRADLAKQLHQRMAQEAGIGWLRVEGVGSRSGIYTQTKTITNILSLLFTLLWFVVMAFL